ncbi:MAG: RNase adapter RapZ [Clostridiales bacterium]|nr:RNase adapter RapZ [Clostridiales bacterium]
MDDKRPLVLITGLSGAGKTTAIRAFEDLEYFCVDNLPPRLLPGLVELIEEAHLPVAGVAAVIDARGRALFDEVLPALSRLEARHQPYEILFLEAADQVLVQRFQEARRPHPLFPGRRLLEAIQEERRRLEPLKGRARLILDTSEMKPRGLMQEIHRLYGGQEGEKLRLILISFGFKRGIPPDADMVLDARFLPNPYYVEELRDLPGTDGRVEEYVWSWPETRKFFGKVKDLVQFLLPLMRSEGRSQLVVAVGCTGGFHRSVVLVERLARELRGPGVEVRVAHRDCGDRAPDGGQP